MDDGRCTVARIMHGGMIHRQGEVTCTINLAYSDKFPPLLFFLIGTVLLSDQNYYLIEAPFYTFANRSGSTLFAYGNMIRYDPTSYTSGSDR